MSIITAIMNIPASSWYHLAAFILTGAGSQYFVQLVKVISKNKYGKNVLRFLNALFSGLLLGIGSLMAGGLSLGEFGKTWLAVASISAIVYRIHKSLLYTQAEKVITDAINDPAASTTPTQPGTKFSMN